MKIKKLTFGFIVAGFFLGVSTIAGLPPATTSSVAQVCETLQAQCIMPQNLSVAY